MHSKSLKAFADRIRELRWNERHLSRGWVAEQLGISRAHLCNMENRKAKPSMELLHKLAKLYGTDAKRLRELLPGRIYDAATFRMREQRRQKSWRTMWRRAGEIIKEWRVASKKSVDQVADELGIGFRYWAMIESGTRPLPLPETIKRVCKVLGRKPRRLLLLRGIAMMPKDVRRTALKRCLPEEYKRLQAAERWAEKELDKDAATGR